MYTTKEIACSRFNELLQESGETLVTLSESIYIGAAVLSKYKCGKTPMPLDVLAAVCKHYDVSADWLLGLTDDRRKKNEPRSAVWVNDWGRKYGLTYGKAVEALQEAGL